MFYHLHHIPKIHVKFDNNQFGSFGDYLSNINRQQTTDQQMETENLFFRTLGVMKRRENIKVVKELITILPKYSRYLFRNETQ